MRTFSLFGAKPSPERFAKLFAQHAKNQGYNEPMKYQADEFRFDLGAGSFFNLDNAYFDYNNASKSDRANVLTKYVAGLNYPEVPSTFEDAKLRLMPIIRGRSLGEYARLSSMIQSGNNDADQGLSQPFSDDAVLQLAYDSEHSLITIGKSSFEKWGVTFDVALQAALGNLRDSAPDRFSPLEQGVVMGNWNDAYDTSRALLSDVVYRANVGNDPIVMIPTRASILISSATNRVGLSRMVDYAVESAEKDGRFVSALMYRFQGAKLIRYVPEDSATDQKLQRFGKRKVAEDYASQKNLLDKLHAVKGVDIFVANCSLAEKKNGETMFTFSTWTKGVDTLLPQTDFVALGVPDESSEKKFFFKTVTWADAQSIGKKIMVQADGYPVRYRVSSFPSEESINAVSAALL